VTNLRDVLWANVGHCIVCARKAFFVSLTGWIIFIFMLFLKLRPEAYVLACVSWVSSTLWLLHIVVFTIKAKLVQIDDDSESDIPRRSLVKKMAAASLSIAFMSIVPSIAFAGPTLIQCSCAGGKTTSGCCPTDSGNVCSCSDPKNPKIQCGDGAVYYGQC
jgi:hypothetical protein